MKRFFSQPLFAVDDRVYTGKEALIAAHLSGDLATLRGEVAARLSLWHQRDPETSPDEQRAEAAAEEFRHERNLLTGEDMEEWLAKREVTFDEWMDAFRRAALSDSLTDDQSNAITNAGPVSDEEIDRHLYIDALVSGSTGRWIQTLARNIALAAELSGDLNEIAPGEHGDEGDHDVERPAVDGGLEGIADHEIAQMATLSRRAEQVRQSAISPELIEKKIESHGLDWIRFRWIAVVSNDEAVAREVVLCVREDGTSIETVARQADIEPEESEGFFCEIEESLRAHFISAHKDELIGPMQFEDSWLVIQVLDREMPSLGDPALIQRVTETILDGIIERRMNESFRWL